MESVRRRLRDAIAGTEENWNKFCAGTTQALPAFQANVNDFEIHNGQLYAGGCFDSSGATPLSNVARWTGSAWAMPDGPHRLLQPWAMRTSIRSSRRP